MCIWKKENNFSLSSSTWQDSITGQDQQAELLCGLEEDTL